MRPVAIISNSSSVYPPVITDPNVLVATTGTGVEELKGGAGKRLFPNSCKERLNILLTGAQEGRSFTNHQTMTMGRTLLTLIAFASALAMHAITVSIMVLENPICTYANGSLLANVSGGEWPYTFVWSNGETTATITDLLPGSYSVTVTDNLGDEATAQITLQVSPFGYGWVNDFFNYGNGLCGPGTTIAVDPALQIVGPPPYTLDGQPLETVWMEGTGQPWEPPIPVLAMPYSPQQYGQTIQLTFSDGTGCTGTLISQIGWPVQWPDIAIMGIQGSCSGTASGSVSLAASAEGNAQYVQWWLQPAPQNGTSAFVNAGTQPLTHMFTGLAPGEYTLTQFMTMNPALPSSGCEQVTEFTIPDLGTDCGMVTGHAFMDYNLNCTRQTNEPYVPGGIVEVQPGPFYTTMNVQGLYSMALLPGSYTAEQQSDLMGEHCTGGPIPFTITAGQTTAVDFPDTSAVYLDVRAMLSSGLARPGFQFQYGILVNNLTPNASGATSLTLTFDPTISFLSATPSPSNVSGNIITWNQPQLTAFQQRNYQVRFEVPPDVGLLGYVLEATANISTANTDGNLDNNTAINYRTITGAYDPNDKLATTNTGGTEYWVLEHDEWIDYTIRFQNTGTDTAFNVIITDTLPANLDPGSIIVGAASHNFTWDLQGHGTLKFYFPNILLPDSNINEPLSHGFVGFRIRPHLPLLPGDEIVNIANIYFDFNPPVITEPSVLVVTTSTGITQAQHGTLTVLPNPTDGLLVVRVGEEDFRPGVLRIRSTDGRVVMELRMPGPEMRMDVGGLASGAYVLELLNGNGPRSVVRFVKQ